MQSYLFRLFALENHLEKSVKMSFIYASNLFDINSVSWTLQVTCNLRFAMLF